MVDKKWRCLNLKKKRKEENTIKKKNKIKQNVLSILKILFLDIRII